MQQISEIPTYRWCPYGHDNYDWREDRSTQILNSTFSQNLPLMFIINSNIINHPHKCPKPMTPSSTGKRHRGAHVSESKQKQQGPGKSSTSGTCFPSNTGAKMPAIGLRTWQSSGCLCADETPIGSENGERRIYLN
ncbi:hypothetical protein LXL04_003839 [Taraxacum kok-saghyz]